MIDELTLVFRHNDTGRILLETPASPDLRDIDLAGAKLSGAAMYAVEVAGMRATRYKHFNLTWKIADLAGASFRSADLSNAVFSGHTLVGADLTDADLTGAILVRSHLLRVNLTNTTLTGARLMNTAFSSCPTLGTAKGLGSVEHRGPSTLDVRTLRSCIEFLPDEFLLGAGYTNTEIESLRALYRKEHKFHSCFISYSRQDSDFADRLRTALIKNNVSCWQDTHDMRPGDYWRRQISDAIEKHDKLILVCSRHALDRPSVIEEIFEAIDRERRTKTQKLFPLRLDDYILSPELEEVARAKVAAGEWRENWVAYVRAYHIPNFGLWRTSTKFRFEFRKLLQALQRPASR